MSVYLKDIPLEKAKARWYTELAEANLKGLLASETIDLDEKAVGRILSETVWAKISSPHYHASAMDGFAVRSEDTHLASATSPVILAVGHQAKYVDTGDPLPEWANAVVPIEQVEALNKDETLADNQRSPELIRIRETKTPWTHVRPMGEDIVATELLLPAGKTITPVDLGAAAASGHTKIAVSKKPRVAILPTGTELIAVGDQVNPGDIIEFNSMVMAGQVNQWGGEALRFPITEDNFDLICKRVQEAAQISDLILLNAGSSAGSEDFSADVIAKLGKLLVHGIAVRPGHPVILGIVFDDNKRPVPIIGVPGYPVSAALTSEIFVKPLLFEWLGIPSIHNETIDAYITRKITSPGGDDDYVRVVTGQVSGKYLAAPLSRGAGVIMSLVRADGYAIIPSGIQGLEAGAKIQVNLLRKREDIDRTIFVIGSHDMSLDILAEELAHRQRRLVSANVGSLGGIMAIKRDEAHLAGSHLLDPETGEYNISYIQKYLKDKPIKLVSWVFREQGLIVNPGNPKQIRSLSDLPQKNINFVNRQRGAGTRILLDYQLNLMGIHSVDIPGYLQEEYTHLSVAAAVKSGRADVGLGIAAAARALDLEFIPLYKERYDLIISKTAYDKELIQPIFDLMFDKNIRQRVQSLPGYDVSCMGSEVLE